MTNSKRRWLRGLTVTLRILGVVMLFAGAGVYVCYRADRLVLRNIAERIVEGANAPAERVVAINNWVHWHGGFVANPQSFVFASMGATPLQVVDGGGDCADKSRLVVALLREVGIASTPVMCFDPKTGRPVHTVVEARLPDREYIVVDPSFNLWFPKKTEPGKYYGVLALRNDPGILQSRLREVVSSRNYWMRVNGYRKDRSVYDRASTFNWDKNIATRGMRRVLSLVYGRDVDRLRRPSVLEEPKLAVACAATLLGVSMIACSAALSFHERRCALKFGEHMERASRSAVESAMENSAARSPAYHTGLVESA